MSLGVRKPKISPAPSSPHVVQMGFKKNDPRSSKTNLQHTTGTSNGTDFCDQMKQNIYILAANTQDGFGEHRVNSTPCVQRNILLYF